ncbi:hypothetical protein VUR80DRAFT_5102 [Thermomyces stellatus]
MSSPTGGPNSKGALTSRDIELLAFGMQSMKDTNVQIDYDKFAELAGLTAGSARVIWGKIRRKLAAAADGDGTPTTPPSQSAKPKGRKGGRKRKAEDTDNGGGGGGDDDVTEPQSPTAIAAECRKKRVKKLAKTHAPAEESENEGGPGEAEGDFQVKAEDGVMIKPEK